MMSGNAAAPIIEEEQRRAREALGAHHQEADMTDSSAPVTDQRAHSAWAVGYVAFASILLLMVGLFRFIAGLVAVTEEQAPRGRTNLVRRTGG